MIYYTEDTRIDHVKSTPADLFFFFFHTLGWDSPSKWWSSKDYPMFAFFFWHVYQMSEPWATYNASWLVTKLSRNLNHNSDRPGGAGKSGGKISGLILI